MTAKERIGLTGVRVLLSLRFLIRWMMLCAETALRVMAVWTTGILYLLVLIPEVRPGRHECIEYVRKVIGAGFKVERETLNRLPCVDGSELKVQNVSTASGRSAVVQLRKLQVRMPGPDVLEDERTRRLQKKIVVKVFNRLFGISPGRKDAMVLSCFSSVSWLCGNMAFAAGVAESEKEQSARNGVVFPVFMSAMKVHLAWLESSTGGFFSRLPWKRRIGRFRGIGEHGEITGCLYPEIISFRKVYLEEDLKSRRLSSRRLRMRTLGRLSLCECGLTALNLAAIRSSGDGIQGLKTVRRLRAVQSLITGGYNGKLDTGRA